MVNPIQPRPVSSPAKPPELPSDIFYAIVCNDDSLVKKAYRRKSFTSYIEVIHQAKGDYYYRSGSLPTFFDKKLEAEHHWQAATEYFNIRTGNTTTQLRLQAFRIVESEWHPQWHDDNVCSFRDACRMTSGVLHYNTVAEQIKKLAGKVLTVLDAAYVNENQNKAVKDLTKNSFRSQLSELYQKAHEDPDCDSCEGTSQKDILDD